MRSKITLLYVFFVLFSIHCLAEDFSSFKIARVKYSGGGDWYNDPSSEVNLLEFIRKNTNINVLPTYTYVDLANDNLFMYPVIYLTGHGNVNFSEKEARNLREYLNSGGFLFIDDDYGLAEYIPKEVKKIYPDKELIELPFSHGIYHCHYDFDSGLPKIHEHDDKPTAGYGIFDNGRLAIFYAVESNLGDGWADPDIHHDAQEIRLSALKMGVNIIVWALTN